MEHAEARCTGSTRTLCSATALDVSSPFPAGKGAGGLGFALVAIDDPHARADQTHAYSIPDGLAEALGPGCLVIAPFGRRLRRGWLLACTDAAPIETPIETVRPLAAALPAAPAPTEAQIALARWLSRRANVALGRALALGLPERHLDGCLPRLRLGKAAAGRAQEVENCAAAEAAAKLLRRLARGPLRLDRVWQLVPPDSGDVLAALERAGVIERLPPVERRSPPPTALTTAPAPIPDKATRELCNAVFSDLSQRRGGVYVVTSHAWPLAAVEQLVRHTIACGRQALLLLPRPNRRAAPVQALLARFPDAAVIASATQLDLVATSQPPLVIGGRWTTLTAFANLGLVLVIDEHDHAYAGERPPYVHGRELALQAARFARATTVLFSPTPDPATLWRAQRAGVRRFTLGAPPPVHTILVDLRQELRAGRAALLSAPLRAALAPVLAAGQQAILLLNRRGSASVLVCRRCGVALRCERCSVALTYHADEQALRCHFCAASAPRPACCPRCGTPTLDELGAGSQRLAAEAQAAFPRAHIARWDRDSTPQKADAALLARVQAREVDLLVGTQLVALDERLPPVALAAAVLADVGLHAADYRAAERTYELLAALRRRVASGGTFVIQTYQPAHWALQALANDDPAVFYGEELRRRQELGYPPFSQLARLTCRAASRARAEAEARTLHTALAARLADAGPALQGAVFGPAPAPIERLRNIYRWQLHLRAPNVQPFLDLVPPHWTVEVDPED